MRGRVTTGPPACPMDGAVPDGRDRSALVGEGVAHAVDAQLGEPVDNFEAPPPGVGTSLPVQPEDDRDQVQPDGRPGCPDVRELSSAPVHGPLADLKR